MIEYLIGLCLLLLVLSHAYLTYSCFMVKPRMAEALSEFHGEMTHAKEGITSEFSDLSTVVTHGVSLIDELVQVLADATPSAPPSGSIIELFLNGLMSKNAMGTEHGPTQNQQWTIQEDDTPPTLETENEHHEPRS